MPSRNNEPWWGEPIASGFADRESDAADIRALQEFVEEGMVESVLGVEKSGKEATVYCCRGGVNAGRELLAAKVYHESAHRGFSRGEEYEQGRFVGSRTMRAAIAAKKDTGRRYQLGLWVEHEFDTLSALGYAGADVPEVFACTDQAVLMEFIGGEDGAAPLLQHAKVDDGDAAALFERLMWNIELWLRENVVHGDLSPFNILVDGTRLVVIDFPQAVDPRTNTSARQLLERDITNVVRFFERYGVEADAGRMADRLWQRFRFGWR